MTTSRVQFSGKVQNIIGICGMNSSGKSSAAAYLSERIRIPRYSVLSTKKEDILQHIERSAIVEDIHLQSEVEFFAQETNFALIAIVSDPAVRFLRWYARRGFLQSQSLEDFILKEEHENPVGDELQQCIARADYVIEHTISLDDLHKKLDDLIARIDIRKLR